MTNPVERIRRYHAELTRIRRDIHAHPGARVRGDAHLRSCVAEQLASWGIEVHRGLAKTGVVGVDPGQDERQRTRDRPARRHGLPADARDRTAFRTNRSTTGACTPAATTATPRCCSARRATSRETRNFDGTAYLIFQPAEEGGGGGKVMVQEGLFERFPADEVYALHNWPGLPPGKMAVRAGPVMAATDEIRSRCAARGGHAAMPHLAVDPVVVAAQVITALQTIASRNVEPARRRSS